MKKCPFCAEEIQEEAIKCKHCGEMLVEEKKPARIANICWKCKRENDADSTVCRACNAPLKNPEEKIGIVCKGCKKEITKSTKSDKSDIFCQSCEEKFRKIGLPVFAVIGIVIIIWCLYSMFNKPDPADTPRPYGNIDKRREENIKIRELAERWKKLKDYEAGK